MATLLDYDTSQSDFDTIKSSIGGLDLDDEGDDEDHVILDACGSSDSDDDSLGIEDDDSDDSFSDRFGSNVELSSEISAPYLNLSLAKHIEDMNGGGDSRALLDPGWLAERNNELLKSMLSLERGRITEQVSSSGAGLFIETVCCTF